MWGSFDRIRLLIDLSICSSEKYCGSSRMRFKVEVRKEHINRSPVVKIPAMVELIAKTARE